MMDERQHYVSPTRGLDKIQIGSHVTRDWGRILVIDPGDIMPVPTEVRADNAFQACRPYPQYGHYIVTIYPHDPKVGKCLLHFPEGESSDPKKQYYHGVQP